jgi:hypothetical protein
MRLDEGFDEAKHPRDKEGQWAASGISWKKTEKGYESADGRYSMHQVKGTRGGKGTWKLKTGGREFDLGERATFGHAEGLIVKHGL